MIQIGQFFFKYRSWVFIPLYLALFIQSPQLLPPEQHYWLILIGLFITVLGQGIRCLTIGLIDVERDGKDKQAHATSLFTEGLFNHCRNPLYIGNHLKLIGMGILANSMLYVAIFIPAFLFIYQTIVLSEENYLRSKFGGEFDAYCQRTNRWIPSFSGITTSVRRMSFSWKRAVANENSIIYVWLLGVFSLLLLKYPEFTSYDEQLQSQLLVFCLLLLTSIFLGINYLKKSNRFGN